VILVIDQYRQVKEPAKWFPLREVEIMDVEGLSFDMVMMADLIIIVGWEGKEFIVMKDRYTPSKDWAPHPVHELNSYISAAVQRYVTYLEDKNNDQSNK